MRPTKPKAFEREAPIIAKVAEASRSNEQLNLDELLPRNLHGWERIQPTDYGYVPHCVCGARLREMPTKRQAQQELRRHLARTPGGTRLLATLRKVGRGVNGS